MPKKNKDNEREIMKEERLSDQKKIKSDFVLGSDFVDEKTGSATMIHLDGETQKSRF